MTSASPSPSNPPPTNLFSRATATSIAGFITSRPWREVFNFSSFTRPYSFGEATVRIKRNFSYFRVNYAFVLLLVLFLSLLWHPVSLIVFLVAFIFWYFLYFSRDAPIVVFGRAIDERLAFGALGVVTIVALVLTGVWVNVVAAVAVGLLVVVVHAAFRRTDDLYSEVEGDREDGSLFSFAGYSRV